jgi:4-diphosphocytidyl-2C-methyl-D-erythritol kinase
MLFLLTSYPQMKLREETTKGYEGFSCSSLTGSGENCFGKVFHDHNKKKFDQKELIEKNP